MHRIVVCEIRKIPEGCFSLALPSKIIFMLLEFYLNANEKPYVDVNLILSSRHVCQIDVSEV